MSELNEDRCDDIVDEQLRHMRGEGPKPDLSGLTAEEHAHALELLELVDALADSLPASPPLADDPVAVRLGLVPATKARVEGPGGGDPVWAAAAEVSSRFGASTVQFELLSRPITGSRGDVGSVLSRSLAEVVLVVVVNDEQPKPATSDADEWFRFRPDLSAVAFTSSDATQAAVVTPNETGAFLVPNEGWRSQGKLTWEPLSIALERYFERSLPRWDEVNALPQGDLLGGLALESGVIIATALGQVADTRPQLAHKRHARDFVADLSADLIAKWVDEVRTRSKTGAELVDDVSEICGAGPA